MFTIKNFYKSKEWVDLLQVLKLERLVQGKLLCEHCGKEIVKSYDCIGHHVIELNDTNVNDYNIALNKDNIKLIHFKCHNLIHQRFEGFYQKVYIVYGSPCSGKTSWVNDVATKDDIVIDLDKIWECVSTCDKFHKPNRLKQNVFGIHNELINQIKMRVGMWKNAYVIGTYPLLMDRVRLADKLGAELIYIDTDKDTCLSRAVDEEWIKFINDWWESYQP